MAEHTMAAPVKDAAWMEWVATLLCGASRQTYAATFPPDRFYCLLDELPLHLLPRGASNAFVQDYLSEPLSLNPHCLIVPAGQLPEGVISQPELVANFALQGTMAWVRDSVSGYSLPFWVGSKFESMIRGLPQEQDARELLNPRDCQMLAAAGILRHGGAPASPANSEDSLEKLRKNFSEKDYAVLPGLLHPFHVAALRRYYRCLIRKGSIALGDSQCPRRYVAYNEAVARFFHHYLTKIVSAVAGEPVKPSYVYMASYLSGSELKKHTDREQCEFSVSVCLDFSPEPESATPWPLCLDTPEGMVRIQQLLGDGLFYRGRRVPHYRDALGEGFTSTSIFFHYVSASFTGSLS
jgi:hypothetical protein